MKCTHCWHNRIWGRFCCKCCRQEILEKPTSTKKRSGDESLNPTALYNAALDTIHRLRDENAALVAERDKLAAFVADRGYVRCDIPACNCGSFHGGRAEERVTSLAAQLEAAHGLLAAIHRDGGHHTAEVGFERSCKGAIIVRDKLAAQLEGAEGELEQAAGYACSKCAELIPARRHDKGGWYHNEGDGIWDQWCHASALRERQYRRKQREQREVSE